MGSRYLFICLYVWIEKYFSKGDYQKNPVKWLKLERSFWLLLVVGILLRCLALNQPLLDAHLTR